MDNHSGHNGAQSAKGIRIGASPVTVAAEGPRSANDSTDRVVAAANHRTLLNLKGIRGNGVAGTTVEVYLNLPATTQPDPRSRYFAGGISLFGLQPRDMPGMQMSATESLDVSRVVAELRARGEWSSRPKVTFVGRDLAGSEPPGGAYATIESATVATD
jgi:hypothetical protein